VVTFRKLNGFGRAGLGNKLFQYAGVKLYAELNGFSCAFPKWIGSEIFKGIEPYSLSQKVRSILLPTIQLDDLPSYDRWQAIQWLLGLKQKLPETFSLKGLYSNPRDGINIFGYLQDQFAIDLLLNHRHLIRSWLQFNSEIERIFYEYTKKFKPWVGVHVRRGDYVKLGLSIPTEKYIKVAEPHIIGRNLFIATNDPTVTKDFNLLRPINLKNPSLSVPDYVFDFWMLMNSEVIIGGGSTFSWWAAFLGNGEYHSLPLPQFWAQTKDLEFKRVLFASG